MSRADEALENLVGMLRKDGIERPALLNAIARAEGKLIGEIAAEGYEENVIRDFGRKVRGHVRR